MCDLLASWTPSNSTDLRVVSNQNSIQQVTFWDEDVVAVVKVWQDLSGRTDIEGREAFQAWKLQRRETMRTNHNVSRS